MNPGAPKARAALGSVGALACFITSVALEVRVPPPRAAHSTAVPCSDEDLAQYALALAAGPQWEDDGRSARVPHCAPALGQGLWPLTHDDAPVMASPSDPADASMANFVRVADDEMEGGSKHLAHLYVVQSNAQWCPPPCMGPTWELAASKASMSSSYTLLEAAIWRQDRRVALYRFDPDWESDARHAYHKVCSQEWTCPAYEIFREKQKLLEVGPWPAAVDLDPEALSQFLLDAFQKIFVKFREVAPDTKYVALTYSGHGARADGSLFEGAIRPADAATLLQGLPASAGKPPMSLLNFGGNCAEGRWNMLAHLHPFADWIIASDLNVGGVKQTPDEMTAKSARVRQELGAMSVIKAAAEAKTPLEDLLEQVVASRQRIWDTVWKAPIQRQNLEQSIAVYRSDAFNAFSTAFRAQFAKLPTCRQMSFKRHTESNDCDVLAAATFLDKETSANQSRAFLQHSGDHRGAARQGSDSLAAKFGALRPMYASTRHLAKWKTHAQGLGFNFLGFHAPPCDLASAV